MARFCLAARSVARAPLRPGKPGRPRFAWGPGLPYTDSLTNETIFALGELPRRLAVLGGGAVGCGPARHSPGWAARSR